MNYMLLIKLLYLLDRSAFRNWGRPVTGDEYFSMKFGPVLSQVLDLITDQPDPENPTYWGDHISEPAHYEVELQVTPESDELSEAEEQMIDKLYSKYGHYNQFDLAQLLHEKLPEWERIERGRSPISYGSLLTAIGKSDEEIAHIEADLSSLAKVQQLFSQSR